ncbi:MAG: tRNA modification GTPase [Candidatus Saganbacteria bacterium]|uniref:tRNA modification GTPase MnmE n=1 Tax=Candidatus Saganbacteria bacterium TaxID=2575572 RepID=A0A833L244_UNCSA|nr:MAG: tRNA modification GTPase [Candidatus Saganbacteria bacterium]
MVRISGEKAQEITKKLLKIKKNHLKPRLMRHGFIKNIDEVLFVYYKAPKSYTGEDVVEIMGHGGITIVKQILARAVDCGARQAERGEFTKRAFLNGKMDLIKAETIISMIQAKTKEGLRAASGQLEGGLSDKINEIRGKLMEKLEKIEAAIDFPGDLILKMGELKIEGIVREIEGMISSAELGKITTEGVKIAIVGEPNVGKSSILNVLLKESRAIVSAIPGTTRDTLAEWANINGVPVMLVDTAGIRKGKDEVEREGIKRAIKSIDEADVVLQIIDVTRGKANKCEIPEGKPLIRVYNKVDLKDCKKCDGIKTSAINNIGIDALEKEIYHKIMSGIRNNGEAVVLSERQRQKLIMAKESLQKMGGSDRISMEASLIALELKEAIIALGEITGKEVSEQVINNIFSKFCVGK